VPAPGIHVHPTADLAPRVLLPGDPGRALALAQLLLDGPKMFNHHRGLWGYTGPAADGELLTIQSTGMGGPSAAIVLEELCDMGVTTAVRVGTCGALVPDLALGELVVAGRALTADGTSRALGAGATVTADPGLVAELETATGTSAATVATTDVFYERDADAERRWRDAGAVAVEMEAAALLRVGELRGIRVACVLAVTDQLADGRRQRLDADGLVAAGAALGAAGTAGLGIPPREAPPAKGLVDPELEREKARRRERAAAADGAG
jgi:uridine phosphorylase